MEWLIGRFDALREQAQETGHLWIWCSCRDFSADTLPGGCRGVFDAARAKLVFGADVFWARESIGLEALGLWLDTYQTTRDVRKRGIVELELP